MYILEIMGLAGKVIKGDDVEKSLPAYLKEYDPSAHNGMGHVSFTKSVEEAIKFLDRDEAVKFIMAVPKNRPLREDGHPNTPLMAFHIMLIDMGPTTALEKLSMADMELVALLDNSKFNKAVSYKIKLVQSYLRGAIDLLKDNEDGKD